jgi:hypothetical protein
MIKVRICKRNSAGALVDKGSLECHGIKVRQPDGSVRAEVDDEGHPVPEEVILHPPGVVSPQAAVRISLALAAGKVRGQIEGVEWFVVC